MDNWTPKEWETVLTEHWPRIFIHTTNRWEHIVVYMWCESQYNSWKEYSTSVKKSVSQIYEVKKERKLILTDAEWEEFKIKNNIKE